MKPPTLIATLLAPVLVAGAAFSATTSARAATPYTFTWINNVTGAAGTTQKIPLIMLRAYINKVNAEGGVNGRPIALQERDIAGDTPKLLVEVRRAAGDDSVLAVLGLGLSGQIEAAVPLLSQLKVTGISNPATAPTATSSYYFSLGLSFAGSGRVAGKFLAQQGNGLKIGVIGFDSPGLRASADGMKSVVEKSGGKVVAAEFVPQSATDASASMNVILSQKPDWIVVSGALDALSKSILDYLKLHGAENIPMLWINNGCSSQLMARANRENFFATCHVAAPSAANSSIAGVSGMRKIALEFGGEDALNGTDDSFTGYGYALGLTLVDALKQCGDSCDREKFKTALQTVKLDLAPMMTKVDLSTPNHLAFLQGVVLKWNIKQQRQELASEWLSLSE
jgi:branched-chain amino acid transport system substrate-binding protein